MFFVSAALLLVLFPLILAVVLACAERFAETTPAVFFWSLLLVPLAMAVRLCVDWHERRRRRAGNAR
jgi:uncharacterized membrane protein YbhN (UPF0104 family)